MDEAHDLDAFLIWSVEDEVARRPWRKGRRDGVWQILPLPQRNLPKQAGGSASAGDLLRDLGFMPE